MGASRHRSAGRARAGHRPRLRRPPRRALLHRRDARHRFRVHRHPPPAAALTFMSIAQPEPTTGLARTQLFALGMGTLFLELALIRYLAGNIWNLGYFPNLVLVAVFVGMGLGFVGHGSLDE